MLPTIAHTQLRWFTRYVQYYLRRNFHGLYLLRLSNLEQLHGRAILVCLNHPSWWDPLVGLYLSRRFFSARVNYGPIAAAGLEKYRFFERLGFFGMDPSSRAGAERFLRVGEEVLSRPDGAFWITPQRSFADVHQRPVQLAGGVGHLARRTRNFAMLPIALEYSFWNERYPEAFAAIGEPVIVEEGRERTAQDWGALYAKALERTQDTLSSLVMKRDPSAFEALLEGSAGIGGVYDVWRAVKARLRGKRFVAEHGRI